MLGDPMRPRMVAAIAATTLSLPLLVVFTTRFLVAADLPHPQPTQQAEISVLPPPPPANTGSGTSADDQGTRPTEAPLGNIPVAPSRIVLDNHDVSGVLGKEIRSTADENMGRIIDIIVDRAGTARAAVIDFGGFLGVGSRKIAVDWNALHFTLKDGKSLITLEMTKDQVKAAPEYQEGKPITVLGALGLLDGPRLTSATPER